jgi:hypothetical protein
LKWNGELIEFVGGTQSFTANIFADSHFQGEETWPRTERIETAGRRTRNDREINGIVIEANKFNAPLLWSGL